MLRKQDLKIGDKYMIQVEVENLPSSYKNGKVFVSNSNSSYFWVSYDALEPVNDKYKQALINLAKADLEYEQAKTIDERASAMDLFGRVWAMREALLIGMELLEDVKNV